ncbi:MAG TPA: hypothetical protein VJK30_05635 [Coxiellaceae bacterium]|nr:MAG: hypothetical protein A3E81_01275 [Gammaproteobacteria bacterium RIFCSPHIGHO2_12_FULL_36_30]HLB56792.1 hypothetical protein [Coxiellaceae bacterium]
MRRRTPPDILYGANICAIESDLKWGELKNKLKSATNYYLKTLEKGSKNVIGAFHGDDGINRAYNLLQYLSIIDNANHFALLALLISIFESTSTWLTTCVSRAFIQGSHSSLSNHRTLSSEVISLRLIADSIDQALIPIPVSDVSFIYQYNKIMGILFILSAIQKKITDASAKENLTRQVQLFKNALKRDPKFFDPETVSACEMHVKKT